MLAGHETTSNLLTWCLRVLSERPDLWARCRAEIDAVIPADEPPSPSHLSSLPFLEAVLHETARLHPAVPWIGRTCIEANTIGVPPNQVHVPKGAHLICSFLAMHK